MGTILANGEVVAAFIAVLVAGLVYLKKTIDARMRRLDSDHKSTTEALGRVAKDVAVAKDNLQNNHDTLLRDDIDVKIEGLSNQISSLAEAMEKESSIREARETRAEKQIDGLRDDFRALTAYTVENVQLLHDRVSKRKQ